MILDHAYAQLTSDTPPEHLLVAGKPFALAAALGLLARIEALPLMALSYPGTAFADAFPPGAIPERAEPIFGGEMPRYRAWRRTVLDILLLGTGQAVEPDPIAGLQRLARLLIGKHAVNPFYTLRICPGPDRLPAQLDRALALALDAQVGDSRRPAFRQALSVLDRLQDHPLATGTGLLPPARIGQLPAPSRHDTHAPLPPRLEKAFGSAPVDVRAALPSVYRLALTLGLVDGGTDLSLSELASERITRALRAIDPADHGFARPSQATLRLYLSRLMRHAAPGPAPKRINFGLPHEQAWSACNAALITRGEISLKTRISTVSKLAKADGLGPAELTPDWVARKLDGLPPAKLNTFRSGVFAIDALHDLEGFPAQLRPMQQSGLARKRGTKD